MLPVIKYMLARLVLFVLVVTLLGVLGAGRELALVGGLLISALLAYVLLGRLRDASTVAILNRVQTRTARRRAARADEDALYEDALVDAQVQDAQAHDAETHDAETHDVQTHDAQTDGAQARREPARDVEEEPARRPAR